MHTISGYAYIVGFHSVATCLFRDNITKMIFSDEKKMLTAKAAILSYTGDDVEQKIK